MPRNMMNKDEMEVRILRLKNELYDGSWSAKNLEWHDGAHAMLDKALNMIQEYRR